MIRRSLALLTAAALLCGPLCPAAAAVATNPSEVSSLTIPAGRIQRAVAALDGLALQYLRKTRVPGIAIAVVHNDKVAYAKGFGVREAGTSKKVDANTIFQLASVSKPVGASVIAGLIRRGVVKWSDPVVKYLPGLKLSDPYVTEHVTLADLYAHRSGLPDHAGDLLEDLGYDRGAVLERLKKKP